MTQDIRVPLAENAIYVSGTVNGVVKTWTRDTDNWWYTTADYSSDGIYKIVLSIIYADGLTTSDSVTLYYGLILVTDRTQADVDKVVKLQLKGWSNMTDQERQEWDAGLKGAYNASDLNRVQGAVTYLKNRLELAGYNVQNIIPGPIWYTSSIPKKPDMDQYLRNVVLLSKFLALPEYTPNLPISMDYLTYSGANAIERVIEIVDSMLTNSLDSVFYSNEIYSGEV